MSTRTTKNTKPYTAPVLEQVTEPPTVDPAYAVGQAIHNGVTSAAVGIKDGVTYVGSKLFNFGKGLFNVHPSH